MAGKKAKKRSRTVIVAADACGYSLPVVNLAVDIAASAGSALRGVFIEDEDLLLLTGLPLAREISLTTASARPASTVRMQRTLRSVSRQFESSLQREAQASKIAWSYEYVRGRIQDFGLEPKLKADFTILGRSGLHRAEAGPRAGVRKVLMISNQSKQQLQALAVVLRRYARDRIELTVAEESGADRLEQALEEIHEDLPADVRIIGIERGELLDRLKRSGTDFDCAILSMHEPAEQLAAVLKALRCPIILVA